MELYTKYNEISVYFSRFEKEKAVKFCEARQKIGQKWDICPFCKKKLKDGSILLLVNNWKLFPNRIVHEACCDEFSSKKKAIKYLYKDYKIAMTYKHWFNVK